MTTRTPWQISGLTDPLPRDGRFVISAINPPNYPITAKELDPYRLGASERVGKGPHLLIVTPIACEYIGFATIENLDPLRIVGLPTVADALRVADEMRKLGRKARVLVLRSDKT